MAMGARQNFGRARRSQSAPRGRRNLHHFEALAPRLVLADSVGPIEFSVDGGMFKDAFQLELAGPPDTVVRYTTDGSQPDETSTTYEQPISIVDPTWIRARAFDADGAPGPVLSQSYLFADESLTQYTDNQPFSSNVPLMFFHTFGNGPHRVNGQDGRFQPTSALLIDSDDANRRADLFDQPFSVTHAGVNACGLAQQICFLDTGWAKRSYQVEIWNETVNGTKPTKSDPSSERSIPIFDLPAESDWMLMGPYTDKTLINEHLVSTWTNNAGRYAPRTQLVEVFMNQRDEPFSYDSHYRGVYVLMETVKVGENRVDITPISPEDDEPSSGGYLWRKGKRLPTQAIFRSESRQDFQVAHPETRSQITDDQLSWLKDHVDEFEGVLNGEQFQDPEVGYEQYIEVDSFVDEWLLVEMTKNIDGFRLDTYFYKDGDGKIVAGPPSGYSLALGNANYLQAAYPEGWYHTLLPETSYGFWARLRQDPYFQQLASERWQELRESVWATDQLVADIDAAVALLSDGNPNLEHPDADEPTNPLSRNYEQYRVLDQYLWPNCYFPEQGGDCPRESPLPDGRRPASYADYVFLLKRFVTERTEWMDGQLLSTATLQPSRGPIDTETTITMTAPDDHDIFFTTDGTDPAEASDAIEYQRPIMLNQSTIITVRSFDTAKGTWSALKQVSYFVGEPGDFDGDGVLDLSDVDLLWAEAKSPRPSRFFDLTGDDQVDSKDRDAMVQDILKTTYGDSNLDGVFDSADLLQVFAQGEYDDREQNNSTFAEGDWNGDGEFNSSDLVLAFRSGGYV